MGKYWTMTKEGRQKIKEAKLKNPTITRYWLGKKFSEEHKKKLKEARNKFFEKGGKPWNWKGGISSRNIHSLYNPKYVEWRNGVFKRDNWKCQVFDKNCIGQLQAHHILSWREYPKLRYIINNGITLCPVHHPRKRTEEKRLIPFFQELVSVSKLL